MLSLKKIHAEEGIPSPLAPSLLVAFYDTQRIRRRYSLLYARHQRAFKIKIFRQKTFNLDLALMTS